MSTPLLSTLAASRSALTATRCHRAHWQSDTATHIHTHTHTYNQTDEVIRQTPPLRVHQR